jgi:hypothetical protein
MWDISKPQVLSARNIRDLNHGSRYPGEKRDNSKPGISIPGNNREITEISTSDIFIVTNNTDLNAGYPPQIRTRDLNAGPLTPVGSTTKIF